MHDSIITHRLFDLSLVSLDLVLQFVDHILESLLALAILVGLECELLKTTVLLTHALGSLCMTTLLVVQLNFQFTNLKMQEF